MKVFVFEKKQHIALPRKRVFSFFENPENLSKITPPSLRFSMLTPLPITLQTGSIIDYTLCSFGLTMRWTTAIAEYAPPLRFVDVQIRGPYSFWHHLHEFHEDAHGTWMYDRVHYALPLGIAGEIMQALLIQRQIESIFEFRTTVIGNLLLNEEPEKNPILETSPEDQR